MIRPLLVGILAFLAPRPASAAAAANAAPTAVTQAAASSLSGSGQMMSMSLVEALNAVDKPELAGIFTYVAERDAPHAFAGLLARDKKSMKRWLAKVDDDLKAAGGLTAWDHEVCAMLVNLYAGALGFVAERPGKKQMSAMNQCVLSPVMSLQDVVGRRKR